MEGVTRGRWRVEIVNCVIIFPVSLLLCRVCGSLIIMTRLAAVNATHRLSGLVLVCTTAA